MQQTWDALEVEVKKKKLPERTILVLADAASGLRVRNAAYRSVADISDQVATKDLKLLVDCGLLIPTGDKKGRSYQASEFVKEIRSRFREPKRVPDPFTRGVASLRQRK
jgi:Fic family protein